MFILTEANDLINSKYIVKIFTIQTREVFEVCFSCNPYNRLLGDNETFNIEGKYFTYRSFETLQEATDTLIELGNILNANES